MMTSVCSYSGWGHQIPVVESKFVISDGLEDPGWMRGQQTWSATTYLTVFSWFLVRVIQTKGTMIEGELFMADLEPNAVIFSPNALLLSQPICHVPWNHGWLDSRSMLFSSLFFQPGRHWFFHCSRNSLRSSSDIPAHLRRMLCFQCWRWCPPPCLPPPPQLPNKARLIIISPIPCQ